MRKGSTPYEDYNFPNQSRKQDYIVEPNLG